MHTMKTAHHFAIAGKVKLGCDHGLQERHELHGNLE